MLNLSFEDNMDLMARYPDKYFDRAFIDPEYGIKAARPSKKPNRATQRNGTVLNVKSPIYEHYNWDDKPASSEFFDEVMRVSKHQIIWGVNYFDRYFGPGRIVWDKLNGESDQMGCEIAYCSLNKRTDIIYFLWSGMMQGMYVGKDVRKALVQQGNKSLNEKRIHPTQKPVALYKYMLHNYAEPGMKILDTNLGSGSLAIACHDYGFDLTGCDNNEKIFSDCMQRVNMHTGKLKMEL